MSFTISRTWSRINRSCCWLLDLLHSAAVANCIGRLLLRSSSKEGMVGVTEVKVVGMVGMVAQEDLYGSLTVFRLETVDS